MSNAKTGCPGCDAGLPRKPAKHIEVCRNCGHLKSEHREEESNVGAVGYFCKDDVPVKHGHRWYLPS